MTVHLAPTPTEAPSDEVAATLARLLAEPIRVLGPMAPGSYGQLARLTSLAEDDGAPDALEMVRRLVADHETLNARTVQLAAEAADDAATIDLGTRPLAVHEETRWMLCATGEAGA